MKNYIWIVAMSICASQFAIAASPVKGASQRESDASAQKSYSLSMENQGEKCLITFDEKGNYRTLDAAQMAALSNDLLDKARAAICGLPILPETVTVSAHFLSVTWTRATLCGDKKPQ